MYTYIYIFFYDINTKFNCQIEFLHFISLIHIPLLFHGLVNSSWLAIRMIMSDKSASYRLPVDDGSRIERETEEIKEKRYAFPA